MNHFSYDVMQKEKIRNLQAEGMTSQSFHRSGTPKLGMLRGLPKLIVILLSILGVLNTGSLNMFEHLAWAMIETPRG